MNRLLEKLARWYFHRFLMPIMMDWLIAETNKNEVLRMQQLAERADQKVKRYIGE